MRDSGFVYRTRDSPDQIRTSGNPAQEPFLERLRRRKHYIKTKHSVPETHHATHLPGAGGVRTYLCGKYRRVVTHFWGPPSMHRHLVVSLYEKTSLCSLKFRVSSSQIISDKGNQSVFVCTGIYREILGNFRARLKMCSITKEINNIVGKCLGGITAESGEYKSRFGSLPKTITSPSK